MSEEEDKGFWYAIGDFFKKVGLKAKLIFGAIVGIFGFIAVFLLRKKINAREILELELKKVRTEVEIEKAQEEIDRNDEKILSLESRIEEIIEEIKTLEEFEARKEVSEDELDEFFDERGFFAETYNLKKLKKLGVQTKFIQDNYSFSKSKNVFRGLHFQSSPHAQAKLIRVLSGSILDIVVDLRQESDSYLSHRMFTLSKKNFLFSI